MYRGPVIDLHAHIAFEERERLADGQALGLPGFLSAVRVDEVERAAAIVMAHRPGDLPATRARNDRLLSAARDSDGFLVPVVSVHPGDGTGALAEVERVASGGARLLKLHPVTQDFDVAGEEVRPLVRRAGGCGLPVLFDGWNPFDPGQLGKFVRLALDCPDSTLILAHLNGPSFVDALVFEVVGRYPWWPDNVRFDLSATAEMFSGGPFADHLRWVIRRLGTDRVFYGSDWPACDPLAALAAVRDLGFTDVEQEQILYSNAAGLLDPA
jgi:predicted TIM-barrel fold metal-dependent hydrolase